jgi:hypothetical protein
MGNPVAFNPLQSRADVERAAAELISPLVPLLSAGHARLHLGDTGAVYPEGIAQMEAFARPLWAIVPMLAGDCAAVKPLWDVWSVGIANGVNPAHPEYWGEVGDFDQRLVEMAVFGFGMCLAPERFFFSLPRDVQVNLARWLNQINMHTMPKNNWVFFRVLVNIGFRACGLPFPAAQQEEDLAHIETHYEGDGWYFDYPNQRDYYSFWAFHYYGLVYALAMKTADPARAETFRWRAIQVAPDFACWFDAGGSALPFGRSLTYRFAQSAFFSAAALSGAVSETVDYGVLKHLLLSNLRQWFAKPIFTRDGVLSIGYGYPNLLMAEGYNAPGSPYWAMKAFACLALPENHPFWTAEEKPYAAPLLSLQPHARMLIARSAKGDHVIGYTAGNHAHEHAHDEAKYEKFAYSTAFGFSVPKAGKLLKDGAFDSMLAVSLDGDTYHPRYGCETYAVTREKVTSVWSPFPNVRIQSEIIPLAENWHMRVHRLTCETEVYIAEGGFAIAREGAGLLQKTANEKDASVRAPWGVSAIYALHGYDTGCVVTPEPNTNLLSPRTELPTLTARLPAGVHTLVCAVYGSPDGATIPTLPQEVGRYANLG